MATADTAPRYYVHDRKVGPLTTFSAINPRYWVIDRESGLAVDEATTKRMATAYAADLNR